MGQFFTREEVFESISILIMHKFFFFSFRDEVYNSQSNNVLFFAADKGFILFHSTQLNLPNLTYSVSSLPSHKPEHLTSEYYLLFLV